MVSRSNTFTKKDTKFLEFSFFSVIWLLVLTYFSKLREILTKSMRNCQTDECRGLYPLITKAKVGLFIDILYPKKAHVL